jgi:hypothetical protein
MSAPSIGTISIERWASSAVGSRPEIQNEKETPANVLNVFYPVKLSHQSAKRGSQPSRPRKIDINRHM